MEAVYTYVYAYVYVHVIVHVHDCLRISVGVRVQMYMHGSARHRGFILCKKMSPSIAFTAVSLQL